MPKFFIQYFFNGSGSCLVKAKNEEEAREKFFNGEFFNTEESGDDYQIEKIKKS